MDDDEKQVALDWLFGTEEELKAMAQRIHNLRQRLVGDDEVLRQRDLGDLETFAHNLEIDAMMFKRSLPQ